MAPEQGQDGENECAENAPMAWVQSKTKAELVEIAKRYKIEATGTITDVRRMVRTFLRENPRFINEARGLSEPGPCPPSETNERYAATSVSNTDFRAVGGISALPLDTASLLTQVRKWGCTFDGRDPIAFLERLEELRESYSYIGDDIIRGFPEIMRGGALLWYRNQRSTWKSWADFEADFRRRYLPLQYHKKLRREVENRIQRPGERFPEFETELITLMRRAGITDEESQVEQLFENLHPDYKIFIKRRDAGSRAELCDLALQFEQIQGQRGHPHPATNVRMTNNKRTLAASTAYKKNECCWRCKQRGHTRQFCKQPSRLFCSQCGKDNVLTRNCHPYPGNASQAEETTVDPRT